MKNIMRRKRFIGYSLGAAALLSAGVVHAACAQADLTGTWYALGVSGDVLTGYLEETNRCKIRISSTGAVVATGSSCVFRTYQGNGTSNITGGSLRVTSACAISGYVKVCYSNGCATIRVQHAQMEKNKTAFPVIGYSDNNPYWLYSFEAVKQ